MNTERPDHEDAAKAATADAAGPAGGAGGGHDDHGGGDDGRGGGGGGDRDGGRSPDDEGGGRFRRGRPPLVAASVAAAVLLAGGGGAYLAMGATGGSDDGRTDAAASGGHGTPPPLALDDHTATVTRSGPGTDGSGPATGGPNGGSNGIAPGEPDPYGTTYRAAGALPEGPGSAPVYAARGEVTREEAARLAAALGVAGAPVADAQGWRIGNVKDGAGPVLRVGRAAPGTWTFNRYLPGTDDCKGLMCRHDPAAPAAHPVSEAAARKAAAPVLKAAGQEGAAVDASRTQGAQRVVEADPVVGGLPTQGWTTSLTLGPQGEVLAAGGQLKAPVKGDTYPVLDARRTLELLNAAPHTGGGGGIGGCAAPVPLKDPAKDRTKDRPAAPCDSSATGGKAAGGSSSAPGGGGTRTTLTVEKAVFGLAAHPSGGRQTLVPSWLFQVRGAAGQSPFTVTYPAVDPKYLASPAPPSGQPEPRPSGPGATTAPATREVHPAGYSASGDELTVTFEGGVCADYRVSAKEDAGRVTVTVTETPWQGKVCIMIAKVYHRTVHLDRPLGERTVVGPDGRAIPSRAAGAGLPQSGTPVR
ncbi:hypothetical protein A8713_08200 [Streptomyces sp. SAT1]|uniref:hypothetical protein n=1 Tax=Streptomyces sp. SAT1 TaxID=1849967 RepID=UPI0007DD880A|nr:hypothetical protein [Streptomyces sp. SAT1]ANH91163.1 hypothetical protein A8713_08200 [Streptomyces sp. SAT1]